MDIVSQGEFVSPRLQALSQWYVGLPRAGGPQVWPETGAMEFSNIPEASRPFVALVDVERSPMRIFYRKLGDALVEAVGMDLTGKYLDEVDIPQAKELPDWFQRGMDAHGALFARSTQTIQHVNLVYEGSCLPFGRPQDDPRSLVICEDFLPADYWNAVMRRRRGA